MNNPFKKILPKHKVSPVVKRNVLLDVKMLEKTFKIADKYVLKYPKTLTNFFIDSKDK
ncbi:hypothetical protein [uncultured Polaribacter sp.]|uniref:hypothetical protein n=1 Tax=uncultured Polaribacter sp. TaxID=174711 RepID=UPI0026179EBA|nr:hypothetical protein [uncultured Polaribacter sp.]